MRLFVALDIDDQVRGRISRYLDGVRGFAPEARWVRPESLHLTLKFIGEQPESIADKIERALQTITAGALELKIRGHGFFPGERAARVFWIGVAANPQLASLAASVDETVAEIGIAKEEHAFNAHLTLAREGSRTSRKSKGDAQGRGFQLLQEKLTAFPAPEFGAMTAREFFLYQSQTMPGGSRYTKLAGFALR